MAEADVILNNSVAEGLPNALLEATVLGRPILARDIPGNAAVVRPGVNGLLYRDGPEFLVSVSRLLDDGVLRAGLSRSDTEGYRPEREAAKLRRLCELMLGKNLAFFLGPAVQDGTEAGPEGDAEGREIDV
jgi:glycosyltransferase involved in cell wall biosynthesis